MTVRIFLAFNVNLFAVSQSCNFCNSIFTQFNGFQVFVSVKDFSIIRKKKEIKFFRAKMNIIYVK